MSNKSVSLKREGIPFFWRYYRQFTA